MKSLVLNYRIGMITLIGAVLSIALWSGANVASEQYLNTEALVELDLPEGNFGVFSQPDQSSDVSGPSFTFNGDALFRWDYYDVEGDASRATFSHTGNHLYLESNLRWSKRESANTNSYHELGLLLNDSQYRADDNALIIERYYSQWDMGDVHHPFRARVGDFLGFHSPRSIQKQLKGVSFELQPRLNISANLSLLLFSGLDTRYYNNLTDDNDEYHGLSSLLQFSNGANFSVNALSARQNDAKNFSSESANQNLIGVTLEWPIVIGRHQILLESEVNHMAGNRRDGEKINSGDGDAFYLSISDTPYERLSYSLTTEHYGRDYNPLGAFVTPDRSTVEARSVWRFKNGLRLSGRAREDTDLRSSDRALTTQVLGMRLNGQLKSSKQPTSISMDGFVQSQFDEFGLRDIDTTNISVNFRRQRKLDTTHIFDITARVTENRINQDSGDEYGIRYSLRKGFNITGWQSVFEPGLLLREVDDDGFSASNNGTTMSPTFRINARKGHRQLNFEYRQVSENRDNVNAENFDRNELSFAYSQRLGMGKFGIDGRLNISSPGNSDDTESARIGVFYKWDLGGRRKQNPSSSDDVITTSMLDLPTSLLFSFSPGLVAGDIQERLNSQNIGMGITQGQNTVFEHTAFSKIDSRQRLVLNTLGNQLNFSAWIIDFADPSNSREIQRDYNDVLEQLIRLLGSPHRSYSEGEFDQNVAEALLANELLHINEWQFANAVVRFGIPPRLDRGVRMEIHYSASRLPGLEELWGVNNIQ